MKDFEKNIRRVTPYVPGEQPTGEVIKLNTNENPYPPAPGVFRVLHGFDADTLRLYPDPTAGDLCAAIAEDLGVGTDEVFVGVGSDDVLSMCFMTFFNGEKPILFPDLTYSFYKVWAELYGVPYETRALGADFHMVREDYYGENGGVIFPNPNAPTSVSESLDFTEDILRHNKDVIVIVDEAYVDFGGESALSLLSRYENLIVVRTFSKSRSLAGMRIGYAVASPLLIKYLNAVKYSVNSYTLSRVAIACGVESVKDKDYFAAQTEKIIATREWTARQLKELGFSFPEPRANFIFATHRGLDIPKLFNDLKAAGIYVRHWDGPRLSDRIRVTIGTPAQMEKLTEFLREYLRVSG